jgi:hypothetical protein
MKVSILVCILTLLLIQSGIEKARKLRHCDVAHIARTGWKLHCIVSPLISGINQAVDVTEQMQTRYMVVLFVEQCNNLLQCNVECVFVEYVRGLSLPIAM